MERDRRGDYDVVSMISLHLLTVLGDQRMQSRDSSLEARIPSHEPSRTIVRDYVIVSY